MKQLLILATFVLCWCAPAQAVVISWEQVSNTSGPSDIVAGGEVAYALNGVPTGAGSDITIGGVTFIADSPLNNIDQIVTWLNDSSGHADYDQLLSMPTYGGALGSGFATLPIDVQQGQSYFIQVWYTDVRGGTGSNPDGRRLMDLGDGSGGATVRLDGSGVGLPDGAPNLGQFVIGTFTADGPTQTLTIDAAPGVNGQPHVTAILVREVPEPAALTLLCAGGCLVMRRRFRA